LVAILFTAVFIVLLVLAGIHVLWALGWRFGNTSVVPEIAGRPAFTPGPVACLAVAALLSTAAALGALASGWFHIAWLPSWIPRVGTGGVSLVFALRAIGDFRLMGLFKRVRGTRFARMDSLLYVPLCLFLAIGCALAAIR
jgi:hypothetical protein